MTAGSPFYAPLWLALSPDRVILDAKQLMGLYFKKSGLFLKTACYICDMIEIFLFHH